MMVSVADLGVWFLGEARPDAQRSVRRFAEEEIFLPYDGGPHQGEAFSCDFQPVMRLFFGEIDSGRWARVAGLAPTQVGKTMGFFVIPSLHSLMELRESVVCGIPDMRMAHDKWAHDLEPIIASSPGLAGQLPDRGEGSKGGKVHSQVTFKCGSTLRFMSAGQRDTGRAGFTARVLAVTEADAMARSSDRAIEANPVEQLEGRLRSHGVWRRRVFLEGTVSVASGLIWREYQQGTASRVMLQCAYCKAWVSPDREHFRGHDAAQSDWEAFEVSHWVCPACEHPWTERDRIDANHRAVLCHRGQRVTKRGHVIGGVPDVLTLGFRFSAVNNLFLTAGDLGVDLYKARHAHDAEDAERKICQQVFAIPYVPPDVELAPLDAAELMQRTAGPKRGIAPKGTYVTVGIDTSKRQLDWVAGAWSPNASGRIIEYGEQAVNSARFGTREALLIAFRDLVPLLRWSTEGGDEILPSAVWIDAHYHQHTEAVFEFCRSMAAAAGSPLGAERYRPCWGEGHSHHMAARYRQPDHPDRAIRVIGREYYLRWIAEARLSVVHVNADHWKTEVRDRLARPIDEPGALALYAAGDDEHEDYIAEVTAERPVEKWSPTKGSYIVWERVRRRNHKLDATYLAAAAAHFVAADLARRQAESQQTGWWSARKRGRRA